MKTKIIVITGGVYSSLGKGIIASSIGCILKHGNFKVSILKLDPYLNTDPGLLNPIQHGEVFITDDGSRTDLDLGHYERFIGENLTHASTQTGGRLYTEIFNDEKLNKFNGATIQIVPHLTNKINEKIDYIIKANNPDFLIIEIGGTIGDIESLAFVEALRLYNAKNKNVLFIHCSPLFQISSNDEIKTKPTQHSIKSLRNLGINPSIIVLRYKELISKDNKQKIAWTCDIDENNIFVSKECKNLYEVPLILFKQGIHKSILNHFNIKNRNINMKSWTNFVDSIFAKKKKTMRICICGKYTKLNDSYISLIESLKIASYKLGIEVVIGLVSYSETKKIDLRKYDGFVIADGDIDDYSDPALTRIISYCHKNNCKLLGIKLGLLALVNYFQPKNIKLINNGSEYQLGLKQIRIVNKTIMYDVYKTTKISERHWNNWWISPRSITNKDIIISSYYKDNIESIEIARHEMLAVMFHPEFVSKPNMPHPLFLWLLKK